jgi:hypothetical protein
MVFYIGLDDNLLYGIDVILSGSPFPASLSNNMPPFGAVRFNFTDGLDV